MSEKVQKLHIPKDIKIGFQNRSDTYTEKLAYVIKHDGKKWCSENSWEGWRDKKIDPVERDNVPTEGFVLNKGVGGVRQSSGWNARNEYVRVYDPRGWEFEITVANLLFILREADCSRGKGLEGKFVYAWPPGQGKVLLLPCGSYDYKVSTEFTKLLGKKLSSRELIKGATYTTKNEMNYIYIGYSHHYRTYNANAYYRCSNAATSMKSAKQKKHIFWKVGSKKGDLRGFEPFSSMAKFAICANEQPDPGFAALDLLWHESPWASLITELNFRDADFNENIFEYDKYYVHIDGGNTSSFYTNQRFKDGYKDDAKYYNYRTYDDREFRLEKGILVIDNKDKAKKSIYAHQRSTYSYPPDFPSRHKQHNRHFASPVIVPWNEHKPQIMVATLESGAKYRVGTHLGDRIHD